MWSQNWRPEESSDDSDHLLCKVLFPFPVDAMKMLLCPQGVFLKSHFHDCVDEGESPLKLHAVTSDHEALGYLISNHGRLIIRHFYTRQR